jgi:hypothetical protein
MAAATVPLPTAVGPARTVTALWPGTVDALGLVGAETADLAGGRDTDLLHDLLGLDLAHAREGLEQGGDAEASDHLVVLGLLQHRGDLFATTTGGVLEAGLDGRALTACLGSLLECGSTLFGRERRKSHCDYLGSVRDRPPAPCRPDDWLDCSALGACSGR